MKKELEEVVTELRGMGFSLSEIKKMLNGEIIADVKVEIDGEDMIVKILDNYDDYQGYCDEYEPGLIEDQNWEACMSEGQWGHEEGTN